MPEPQDVASKFAPGNPCFVASAMLGYAAWGQPAYSYFGLMKVAVLVLGIYSAWALYKAKPQLVVLSLALVVFGAYLSIGHLRRSEWFPIDVAGCVIFAIAGALLANGGKSN